MIFMSFILHQAGHRKSMLHTNNSVLLIRILKGKVYIYFVKE